MKYCEEYAALLDAFADGECTPEEAQRVREHLPDCPGCRSYLSEIELLRGAFPDPEDTAVPDGFAEGVMAAVRADAAPRRHTGRRWVQAAVSLAACAAIVLALRMAPMGANTALSAAGAAADSAGTEEAQVYAAEASDSETGETSANASLTQNSSAPVARDIPGGGMTQSTAGGAPASSAKSGAGASSPESAGESSDKLGIMLTAPAADTACSRRATVELTEEQESRLLAGYTGEDAAGCRTYELTAEQFDAVLDAIAKEGIEVSLATDEADPDGPCRLCVYPAA